MTPPEFLRFLHTEQKETFMSLEDATALIQTFISEKGATPVFTPTSFSNYVLSQNNDVCNPSVVDAAQDMNQPLTSYFINSSHNTYLEGNQLSGTSSTDMYIQVLKSGCQSGCRCIELDLWDGDDGIPRILHGHTLTSKITLNDVVWAISVYGFYASEFPLILSLENHLSHGQQTYMAQCFINHLSAYLPKSKPSGDVLPSPNELKNKILLKGTMEVVEKGDKKEKEKKVKIVPELAELIYLKSVPFPGLHCGRHSPDEMCSFSELKLNEFQKCSVEFVRFNQQFLTRIYPKGTRFDSTNYDPTSWWALGSHMVALNFQTGDKHLWTNAGKFRLNGGCGMVLKPPSLFSKPLDLLTWSGTLPDNKVSTLRVQVLSARQLPKPKREGLSKGKGLLYNLVKTPPINPYVEMLIMGLPCDYQRGRTKRIANNGFNPTWNETFLFTLKASVMATLVISVWNDDSIGKTPVAQYSLPVDAIRPGYRFVDLNTVDGIGRDLSMCNLLCKFEVQ
eukprot:CAMPEP_0177644390 /NCGR_PEP_ID=MMETSP0447-20121125/8663_1 /TAXON_ID=0 /ORGANISM="Stygamoeba regulata, Strain BSH-02190019" /LENGTH=506 /DNA_ID=CAMNT_0019146749 /DNA_START=55 /DNA_END=1575 /DNA_ORIENTATION=-